MNPEPALLEEEREWLAARLEEERRKGEEVTLHLRRLQADFDNYRRRMMAEQSRWQELALSRFFLELLPVLDDLERAVASAGEGTGDPFRRGVEMILSRFQAVLEGAGVVPVESRGVPFDPAVHEAFERVEGEEFERETVTEELRKGYLYRGRCLRPALVRVGVPKGKKEGG